jgi:hypothetical protein
VSGASGCSTVLPLRPGKPPPNASRPSETAFQSPCQPVSRLQCLSSGRGGVVRAGSWCDGVRDGGIGSGEAVAASKSSLPCICWEASNDEKANEKSESKDHEKSKAKTTRAATTTRCPNSERAKVPGMVVALKDMANPCVFAKMNGVPITRLRATQVRMVLQDIWSMPFPLQNRSGHQITPSRLEPNRRRH